MKYFTLAALLVLGTSAFALADGPGDQDILYFSKDGPVLVRLEIEIDGKPVQSLFRNYLKKWVDYLDRDGDGKLNANELRFMPLKNYAQNLFRYGYTYFNPKTSLTPDKLGKGPNDLITLEDLASYYQDANVSAVQVVQTYAGQNKKSAAAEFLVAKLDANSDGKLSKKELAAGYSLLKKFDLNDDELITQQELVGNPNAGYYGGIAPPIKIQPGGGAYYAGSTFYLLSPGKNQAQMPAMILSRYDKNTDYKLDLKESGLDKASFQRLDTDQDQFLTLNELTNFPRFIQPIPLVVRIGKRNPNQEEVSLKMPAGQKPKGISIAKSDQGKIFLKFGEIRLSFHGLPVNQQIVAFGAGGTGNYLLQLFKAANPQNKAFLELKDLDKNQFTMLKSMFPALDRNEDGKLTQTEVNDFLALQNAARTSFASIRLNEEGHDLFQLLDTNRDGRLSPRELLNSWSTLASMDQNKDGVISSEEFGQQYVAMVSLGQMNYNFNPNLGNPLAVPVGGKTGKSGPVWFQKMDTNHDGDLTPREFLGTQAQFQKLDANADGLLDAQEAENAAQLFTPKKSG